MARLPYIEFGGSATRLARKMMRYMSAKHLLWLESAMNALCIILRPLGSFGFIYLLPSLFFGLDRVGLTLWQAKKCDREGQQQLGQVWAEAIKRDNVRNVENVFAKYQRMKQQKPLESGRDA